MKLASTQLVAVGTTIADRPLRRSVRARLRIRLLGRMSGVEASLRIRVQDFRARYPAFEQRSESLPPFAGTLTAACEYLIPQPVDALPEGAQLPDISGHRVVLVVAVDDLPKPCTDFARASMHPAAKLDLDGLELRNPSAFSP